MIRILLAEDQAMVRTALAALLALENGFQVVGETDSGETALEEISRARPDVLVADIEMPGMSGLELAAAVRERHPDVRVLMLTTFGRPGYLRRALDAGVAGYLLKEHPVATLANAIRRVAAGLRVIDPDLAEDARAVRDPLTDRERNVLREAEQGLPGAAIAERLHLSERTVRNYLSEAIIKLGASNRTEAARIARERGWL